MSSSTRKQKGSWCDAFGNLVLKAYFESCQQLQNFNYWGFLVWSKGHLMGKVRVWQEWSNARTFLCKSHHQLLQEATVKLDKAWESCLDEEYEMDFFWQQQDLCRLVNGCCTVHAAADKVIIKQQCIEFEEEERSLDGDLHSSKCIEWSCAPALFPVFMVVSDFASNWMLIEGRGNFTETGQDALSSEEEEDLVEGQKTPPKPVQGHFNAVPLVKEYDIYYVVTVYELWYCSIADDVFFCIL